MTSVHGLCYSYQVRVGRWFDAPNTNRQLSNNLVEISPIQKPSAQVPKAFILHGIMQKNKNLFVRKDLI